jgi:hypothetical protein
MDCVRSNGRIVRELLSKRLRAVLIATVMLAVAGRAANAVVDPTPPPGRQQPPAANEVEILDPHSSGFRSGYDRDDENAARVRQARAQRSATRQSLLERVPK